MTHAHGVTGSPSDQDRNYCLVDPSPWPIVMSGAVLVLATGAVIWLSGHKGEPIFPHSKEIGSVAFFIGLAAVLATMFVWWRDVINEAHQPGLHTRTVRNGLRWGMALFIFSEVMFFVAWFWAFFNSATFPTDAVQYVRTEVFGGVWPPQGTMVINPWRLPIINTVILVSSGGSLMWGLKGLHDGKRDQLIKGLLITIVLGLLFTALQAYEFIHAPFVFGYDPRHPTANNYGSTFFMATGFHGMHVIIGTIFLFVCLLRAYAGHFKPEQHLGLEFAEWYWHFVDVVWIFLFLCIYVWGNWGGHFE
jgi:cytochrome c oxidase subunit III